MILHHQPIVARQVVLPLSILAALAIVVHYLFGFGAATGLWIIVVVVVYLFRDPRRQVPPLPLAIVAPIDGKVIALDQVHDPYLNRKALCVQINYSLPGVFSVRSPMEGKINKQWFGTLPEDESGGIYAARSIPAFAQWVQSDEGDNVVLTLSPGIGRDGIRLSVGSGERIGQGQRFSFIPFGANTETFIPVNSRIDVKPGDTVKAGSSVIATLIR